MVLSLSINRINYQFMKMLKRGLIHQEWIFLADSMNATNRKVLTSKELKEFWENAEKAETSLVADEAKLESIENRMDEIDDSDNPESFEDEYNELKNQRRALRKEIKTFKKTIEDSKEYDLALDAKIGPPKISIRKDSFKDLTFIIPFKIGSTLYYTSNSGKKATYDLGAGGYQYAFRCSISRIQITDQAKIVVGESNGNEVVKTLRDHGISNEDFTIESLFLDVENANIATYDESLSKLPVDKNLIPSLIAAIATYFSSLKDDTNPYILGYGISKPKLKPQEKAMFYPTGVTYSSSFSTEERKSTFNFCMLLDMHPFPGGNDAGNLPKSLMTYAQDATTTVNGVFGLDRGEFEKTYIPNLSRILCDKLNNNSMPIFSGGSVSGKNIRVNIGGGLKKARMSFMYSGIKSAPDNKGLDINYTIRANGLKHQEIKEILGTVGVEWPVSTAGNKHNTRGQDGLLSIKMRVGASGKLELTPRMARKLSFGIDTDKPIYKDGFDSFWDSLNKAVQAFVKILTTLDVEIGKDLSSLSSLDKIGQALNINNLSNMERRVVLPISNVYTYKNVRLYNNGDSSNDSILFDTSYAIVSE